MKRLLKKVAVGNIELFHTTSSQVLKKIKESGGLLPNSETGVTSNGIEYGNENGEKIPSGNSNGIYLADDEEVLMYYRENVVNATQFDKDLPNIPVDLKVDVSTDNLQPDLDDLVVLLEDPDSEEELNALFDDFTPAWETSLMEINQVVHEGSIPISNITGVKFINEDIISTSDVDIEEFITFNSWMDIEQAIEQLNKLEDSVLNSSKVEVTSRLKKRKREM